MEQKQANWLHVFFVVIFLLIAVLHYSSVNNELNSLGGDNAGYILSAEHLSNFDGYLSSKPGNPPKTHHAPLFSLLLAPVIWLFGINFAAIHSVIVTTELLALILLFFLFRRQAGEPVAAAVCLVFALNPFINLSLVRILTEFPYVLVTALALLVAEYGEKERDSRRSVQYLWLPFLVVTAYFTRFAGLSFFVAFILYRLYRRQFKLLLWNAPLLFVPRIFWMVRARLTSVDEGYLKDFWMINYRDPSMGDATLTGLGLRIWENCGSLANEISSFLLPFTQQHEYWVIFFVCGLALAGFVRRWLVSGCNLMEIYTLVYLGMVLVWPVYEPRKVMPVMPCVLLYIFVGMNWGIQFFMQSVFNRDPGQESGTSPINATVKGWAAVGVIILGAIAVAGQIPPTLQLVRLRSVPLYYPPLGTSEYAGFTIDWSHFREMIYWCKLPNGEGRIQAWTDYLYLSRVAGEIIPPDAAILARKPTLTALYSKRPAIDYPFYNDFEKQYNFIVEYGISYILSDGVFRETARYLVPFLNAHNDSFVPVARSGRAVLLKIDRDRLDEAFAKGMNESR